ncbi:hypothetical protein ACFVVX_15195 [Kitasatospora sp. NPDC058170]|uniref:hypothetical protein n=1 Tax=Kitasatospora sp. NPDC058170 TaxID=3346364 RepID=UPI0036DF975C
MYAALAVLCSVTAAVQTWGLVAPAGPGMRAERAALTLRLGCVAEASSETTEITESMCTTEAVQYRILTFSSDDGCRQWLDLAKDYGGTYLTGRKWVVAAWPTEYLVPLRRRLGGVLETGTAHGAADGKDDLHTHGG